MHSLLRSRKLSTAFASYIYQALTLNVLVKDKMRDKLIPTISISKDMTKRAYAYDDDYVNCECKV